MPLKLRLDKGIILGNYWTDCTRLLNAFEIETTQPLYARTEANPCTRLLNAFEIETTNGDCYVPTPHAAQGCSMPLKLRQEQEETCSLFQDQLHKAAQCL